MKTTTKISVAVSVLLGALAWLGAAAQSNQPLLGSWKLVSVETRAADGEVDYPYGKSPSGVIMYDASGRMSVHLLDAVRPKFASNDLRGGTPDEVQKAFNSYTGYFGTYTYDSSAQTVTHHLEGCVFPNWSGTDQLRRITLKGDHLTLSSLPYLRAGKERTIMVQWVKLK